MLRARLDAAFTGISRAAVDAGSVSASIATTEAFARATRRSTNASTLGAILRSDELADTVESVEISQFDLVELASIDARVAAVPADVLSAADPLGLITPQRDLTQGEWSLLTIIVSSVAFIALDGYDQTAEETAAVSVIAFFLIRALLSSRNQPWT